MLERDFKTNSYWKIQVLIFNRLEKLGKSSEKKKNLKGGDIHPLSLVSPGVERNSRNLAYRIYFLVVVFFLERFYSRYQQLYKFKQETAFT